MSSRVRLVEAGAADADALSAAGRRLFVQAYGNYSRADDLESHVEKYFGRDGVASELQNSDVSYTIAFDADAIAGFIKIRRGAAPAAVPVADAIEVQQLYVDAEWQRKGVGRALMDRAVAVARQEGRAGLWLSVWREAGWATAFYEAYGFRKSGAAEFWLGRTCFVDDLMWLPLNRAS